MFYSGCLYLAVARLSKIIDVLEYWLNKRIINANFNKHILGLRFYSGSTLAAGNKYKWKRNRSVKQYSWTGLWFHEKKWIFCVVVNERRFNRGVYRYRAPGTPVNIATDYGLDGREIESRWGRVFPPVRTGPGAHPASCKVGTGSSPGLKCGRGVLLTIHPLCRGHGRVELYLYPLSGPYRACKAITLSFTFSITL